MVEATLSTSGLTTAPHYLNLTMRLVLKMQLSKTTVWQGLTLGRQPRASASFRSIRNCGIGKCRPLPVVQMPVVNNLTMSASSAGGLPAV